jgi:hypothetical protein
VPHPHGHNPALNQAIQPIELMSNNVPVLVGNAYDIAATISLKPLRSTVRILDTTPTTQGIVFVLRARARCINTSNHAAVIIQFNPVSYKLPLRCIIIRRRRFDHSGEANLAAERIVEILYGSARPTRVPEYRIEYRPRG